MPFATQCQHFRNAISFETCKAGVRYSDLVGVSRTRMGDESLNPGLPCWCGAVDGRKECPCYEALGDEAADLLS